MQESKVAESNVYETHWLPKLDNGKYLSIRNLRSMNNEIIACISLNNNSCKIFFNKEICKLNPQKNKTQWEVVLWTDYGKQVFPDFKYSSCLLVHFNIKSIFPINHIDCIKIVNYDIQTNMINYVEVDGTNKSIKMTPIYTV